MHGDDRQGNGRRWAFMIGAAVLIGLVLAGVYVVLLRPLAGVPGGEFSSNGEQIFFTATSQRGTPITADMGGGPMMGGMMFGGSLSCASCHGPDGRGGELQMMGRSIEVPDIRWEALTSEEHGAEMEHESYTEETIRQAITQGVDPAGEPLNWPMPRWSMSEEDLDDLIEYLKTLE